MLFRTLPVADPDGLVRLRWTGDNGAARGVTSFGSIGGMGVSESFSHPVFEALRDANETLAGMFAATPTSLTLVIDGRAEIATGLAATGDYFRVLGVQPAAGRAIGPDDDRRGAEPVAMISHSFRERRFGPEADAVGRVIRVNDVPTTIVGVLPPGYAGIRRPDAAAADVHLPLATLPLPEGDDRLADATFWWLPIMGRLAPGVTPAQVQGNLDGGTPGRRAVGAGVVPGRPAGGGAASRAEPGTEHRAAAARLFRPAGPLRREPPVIGSGARPQRRRHPRAAHRVRQRGHAAAVAGGGARAGGGNPHVGRRYARAADSATADREPAPLRGRWDARPARSVGGAPPAAVRPGEPVRLAGLRLRGGTEPRGRHRVQSRARPARHPRRSVGRAQGAEPERNAGALAAEPGPDRGPGRACRWCCSSAPGSS